MATEFIISVEEDLPEEERCRLLELFEDIVGRNNYYLDDSSAEII